MVNIFFMMAYLVNLENYLKKHCRFTTETEKHFV